MRKLTFICCAVLGNVAVAAQLACPGHTPATQNGAAQPLTSVRVISFAANSRRPTSEALPIHAPDTEYRDKHKVRQVWRVNLDAPEYKYELHCIYGEKDQLLRFEIPASVKSCAATDNLKTTKFTMTCD